MLGQKLAGGILKAVNSTGRETRANTKAGSSQGLNPLAPAARYHNDNEKTVYYNEQKSWYKDLYNLLWDLDLKENVYLVL